MPANYFQLPAFRAPPPLDFSPLNDAIDKWGETNRLNAMQTYREGRDKKADARADENQSMRREEYQTEVRGRKAKVLGGMAQSLLDAKTPEDRANMLAAWQQQDPELAADLQKHGYNVNDVERWAPAAIGMARGYQDPMDKRKAEADIRYTESRADYYASGRPGAGGAGGGRAAIIDRLMQEDENLSYSEALALSQRAPRDETVSRERLAVDAARNAIDPQELDTYRDRYGVGPNSQRQPGRTGAVERPAAQPNTNRFDFSGPMRAGSRDNPIRPRSQADIDRAPPGTVFEIDGRRMVKP